MEKAQAVVEATQILQKHATQTTALLNALLNVMAAKGALSRQEISTILDTAETLCRAAATPGTKGDATDVIRRLRGDLLG